MRLLGLSRKAFLAVLVAVLALGAGGIAIANHSDKGKPSADRVAYSTFSANQQERRTAFCTGEDNAPYEELKQRFTGEASGDPRFDGPIVVHQRVLIRLGGPEPIGQAFGTVEYFDRADPRRTKAFVTFLAALDLETPPSSPTAGDAVIRAEGLFFGDVFARRGSSRPPLNVGRVFSNFRSSVSNNATQANGEFGGGEPVAPGEGRDNPANTGILMKGDCGLGFAKAYRKTFGHAPGKGHGKDEGRGRGKGKGRGDDGDRGKGKGKGRGRGR